MAEGLFCLNVKLCIKPERREEFLKCIEANAHGTRTTEKLAVEYTWGEDTTPLLEHDGKCPALLVASDCLYEWDDEPANALERTLRDLISRGGCRAVLFAWEVRHGREAGFLERLAELGTLEPTIWGKEERTGESLGIRILRVS